jgi:hypothetical protein
MVFATAARHDKTLACRQSAIGAPDSETFKALADHGEAKGNRRALCVAKRCLTAAPTLAKQT